MSAINSNLEAALRYARRGWHVYPALDKARALVRALSRPR